MFSRRSGVARPANPLAQALSRARAAGRPVLDLTESNPTRARIPYDEAAILGALRGPRALSYEPEPFGLLAAPEAVPPTLADARPPPDAAPIVVTASPSAPLA